MVSTTFGINRGLEIRSLEISMKKSRQNEMSSAACITISPKFFLIFWQVKFVFEYVNKNAF